LWRLAVLVLAFVAPSCGGSPVVRDAAERRYPFKGQVLSVSADSKQASIDHDEIPGFMSAMTMTYEARDPKEFEGLKAGDLITATLVVVSNGASLVEVKKVGEAPLKTPAAPAQEAPPASSGFEMLRPGDAVPDVVFVDQDGRERSFTSFKGSPVVLTFIYTRCPMPAFCPLMDRHFTAIQAGLEKEPALAAVRLASVSFDPTTDTPEVMKSHAAKLGADPKRWSFLTGDRDAIDQFAARFGVSLVREGNAQRDITHNLRTAIVDDGGRLFKIYVGNSWTPDEVIADLKKLG
jgi:protein SCO1/2